MKYSLAAAALAMLVAACPASAADEKDEEGWVTIFDGSSLDGWKINESAESWKLEDGVLTANGPRSHIFYVGDEEPFVNFDFEAELMTEPGSNSGIFFHTKFQDSNWPKQGYECQVNNTYERDPQKTGGLYNTVKVLKAPAKDNEWYTQRITVQGKRVVVKINGKSVVDFVEPDDVEGTVKLSQGTFALQAHDPGSTVHYRKIRVRRLP